MSIMIPAPGPDEIQVKAGELVVRNEIKRVAEVVASWEGKVADLKGDLERAQTFLDAQILRLNSLTKDLEAIRAARK